MTCARCGKHRPVGAAYEFGYGRGMPGGGFELGGWAKTWLCNRCAGKALSGQVSTGAKVLAGILGIVAVGTFLLIVVNFALGFRLLGLLAIPLTAVLVGSGYGMYRLSGGDRVNNPRADDPDLSATVPVEELAIRLRREEFARLGFDTLLTRLECARRAGSPTVP